MPYPKYVSDAEFREHPRNTGASGTFTHETGSNAIAEPTLNATLFDSTGSQVFIFHSKLATPAAQRSAQ